MLNYFGEDIATFYNKANSYEAQLGLNLIDVYNRKGIDGLLANSESDIRKLVTLTAITDAVHYDEANAEELISYALAEYDLDEMPLSPFYDIVNVIETVAGTGIVSWNSVQGKPPSFPTNIANVSGLQAQLTALGQADTELADSMIDLRGGYSGNLLDIATDISDIEAQLPTFAIAADVTDSFTELRNGYGGTLDDLDSRIDEIESHYKGTFISEAALIAAFPTASVGDYALVDTPGVEAKRYIWDATDSEWVEGGGSGAVLSVNSMTGVVVLTKSDISLGNVDNTSDANKPISTAQAAVNTAQATTNSTQSGINTAQATTNSNQVTINTAQTATNAAQAATNTTQAGINTAQATTNSNQATTNAGFVTDIAGKEPAITGTTSADFWSGAKSFLNLASAVRATPYTGLSSTSGTPTATDTVLTFGNKVLYFITNIAATILANPLTGWVVGTVATLTSSDTILSAFGKIQANINDINTRLPQANLLTSGTLPDARLSTNVPLLASDNMFTGSNTFGSTNTVPAVTGGATIYSRQTGVSTTNWKGRIVAGGDNVAFLLGEFRSQAWLGAHNAALSAWEDLYINPDGTKKLFLGDSAGSGVAYAAIAVVDNATGFVYIGASTNTTAAASAQLQVTGKIWTSGSIGLASTLTISGGSGTPEAAITAAIGSVYLRTDAATGSQLYVKETGTGNTGWVSISGTPFVDVTTTTQAAAVNTKYKANNASRVTVTLPATGTLGDQVFIRGYGTGGWRMQANTGQVIHGASDTSVGGYMESSNRYDTLAVEALVVSGSNITEWSRIGVNGTLTIA